MRRWWLFASILLSGFTVLLSGCTLLAPVGRVASSAPTGETGVEPFQSSVTAVTDDVVPYSWRPECPVPLEDLRLLMLPHWGMDEQPHAGRLIVHADHADGIVAVMEQLYAARFPIERMELVDVYGGDDDASMAANNTSAFNCREVSRRPGVWSQHAYGSAIDINPVQNPYILPNGTVLPPGALTDRSRDEPGLVSPGDAAVQAFAAIGWGWGGEWDGVKDYQHFSASGR